MDRYGAIRTGSSLTMQRLDLAFFVSPFAALVFLGVPGSEIFASWTHDQEAWREINLYVPPTSNQPRESSTIAGSFIDGAEKPIEGVHVLLRISRTETREARSDASGRFQITMEGHAGERMIYDVLCRKQGYAMRALKGEVRVGQRIEVGRLTLCPGGTIAGSVVDTHGDPVAGALLCLVSAERHEPPSRGRRSPGPPWALVADRGRSDEQGAFEIIGVPTGTWYVAAKHRSTYWAWSDPIASTSVGTSRIPAFQVEPLPAEYRIGGLVVDRDGTPVPDAAVSSLLVPTLLEARTNQAGEFTLFLTELTRRPLDLRVEPAIDELYFRYVTGVLPGTTDLVVEIPPTRELQIHVVDARGRSVEQFGWGIATQEGRTRVTRRAKPELHEGGRVTLRVPDTEFELEIRGDADRRKLVKGSVFDPMPAAIEVILD